MFEAKRLKIAQAEAFDTIDSDTYFVVCYRAGCRASYFVARKQPLPERDLCYIRRELSLTRNAYLLSSRQDEMLL